MAFYANGTEGPCVVCGLKFEKGQEKLWDRTGPNVKASLRHATCDVPYRRGERAIAREVDWPQRLNALRAESQPSAEVGCIVCGRAGL